VHEEEDGEDNEELVGRNKARLLRLLRDRWQCRVKEHTYCYRDEDMDLHLPMSDADLALWVNAMVS
jgi:hypothetical protein